MKILAKNNNKLDIRMWTFISKYKLSSNLNELIFNKFKVEFDYLFDLILLKEYESGLTPYFYRLASMSRINGNNIPNTFTELKDFISDLIDYHGIDSLFSEFYIFYDRAMSKYLSFDRPRSSVSLFLIRNIMLYFRDYFRGQSGLIRKISKEVKLDLCNISYEMDYTNPVNDLLDTNTLAFFGYEYNVSRLHKYLLYNIIYYNMKIGDLSNLTGLPIEYIREIIKRSINEQKG